jgi:hypothetical protein
LVLADVTGLIDPPPTPQQRQQLRQAEAADRAEEHLDRIQDLTDDFHQQHPNW